MPPAPTSASSHFHTARIAAAALVFAAVAACGDGGSTAPAGEEFDTSGRLTARVAAPTAAALPVGLSVQSITPEGRSIGVYLPTNYSASTNWPLTVLLHGSGGSGEGMALDFQTYAEAAGVVVIAPNSRKITWDRIADDEYGPDVAHIDEVLEWAFDRVAVDPARVSISGFSDGASYSILIGLKNGDLFSRVAAFTPCAGVPGNRHGTPTVFISHGIDDMVRNIDECSRLTVPMLRDRGYTVEFVEYPSAQGNGHFITTTVLTQGMAYLAGN